MRSPTAGTWLTARELLKLLAQLFSSGRVPMPSAGSRQTLWTLTVSDQAHGTPRSLKALMNRRGNSGLCGSKTEPPSLDSLRGGGKTYFTT